VKEKGLNSKEINIKLARKRKKYFSWRYRYDMIIKEFKYKSIQWKISFLNSNINFIPQNDSIKRSNIKRLIKWLKADNLYDDWEDELNEFLEFEKFYLSSAKLNEELLNTNNQLQNTFHENLHPIQWLNLGEKLNLNIPFNNPPLFGFGIPHATSLLNNLKFNTDNNFKTFDWTLHDDWITVKKLSAKNLSLKEKNNPKEEYNQRIRQEFETMYANGNNYINKEDLFLELKSGYNIQNSNLIYCRIPIRRRFVDRSKFETSTAKAERIFKISVNEEKRLNAIKRVESKIKDRRKISDPEYMMLTNMVLNKFDKPLKFNEVRNMIKNIIWKLAIEELEQLRSIFYDATKQTMFYYKFGSSLKKKNSNYFLSFKTETILELFLRENFPENCKSMFSEGID
jgi:hypothetical protein